MQKSIVAVLSLLALVVVVGCLPALAQQSTRRDRRNRETTPAVGRLSVKTSPGTYPVLVNGRPSGLSGNPTPALTDLAPGTYLVEILFPNRTWSKEIVVNAGKSSCVCLQFVKTEVKKFCPYDISVSGPESVQDGDLVTFSSVSNYGGEKPLAFNWTVSPESARITSGQGTQTITVDTTGLGGQAVSATLNTDDTSGDPTCRAANNFTTNVTALPPVVPEIIKFDSTVFTNYDDIKARLDNYAIELQNRPDNRAYIIVYGPRPRNVERFGVRTLDYLTRTRGIDPSRVTLTNGGFRREQSIEMFLLPPNAPEPPQPTPEQR